MLNKHSITTNTKLLIEAARNGNHNEVLRLIPLSQPSDLRNKALQKATEQGHLECVKSLLPVSNLDDIGATETFLRTLVLKSSSMLPDILPLLPENKKNSILENAAINGKTNLVEFLIPLTNPKDVNCHALTMAAIKGHTRIVQKLLPYFNKQRDTSLLTMAVHSGSVDTLKVCLPLATPKMAAHALSQACIRDKTNLIEYIIPILPPKLVEEHVIAHVIREGRTDLVHKLLPLYDLKKCSAEALRAAAQTGNQQLVDLFLPTAPPKSHGKALEQAAHNGHTEIVKRLMPLATSYNKNTVFDHIVEENYEDLFDLLAKDLSKTEQQDVFKMSARHGNLNFVKQMLPFVNPKANKSCALLLATLNEHDDVIHFLLPHSDGKAVLNTIEKKFNHHSRELLQTLVEEQMVHQQKERLLGKVEHITSKHQPKRKM